jgi:hypothetical protein
MVNKVHHLVTVTEEKEAAAAKAAPKAAGKASK